MIHPSNIQCTYNRELVRFLRRVRKHVVRLLLLLQLLSRRWQRVLTRDTCLALEEGEIPLTKAIADIMRRITTSIQPQPYFLVLWLLLLLLLCARECMSSCFHEYIAYK